MIPNKAKVPLAALTGAYAVLFALVEWGDTHGDQLAHKALTTVIFMPICFGAIIGALHFFVGRYNEAKRENRRLSVRRLVPDEEFAVEVLGGAARGCLVVIGCSIVILVCILPLLQLALTTL